MPIYFERPTKPKAFIAVQFDGKNANELEEEFSALGLKVYVRANDRAEALACIVSENVPLRPGQWLVYDSANPNVSLQAYRDAAFQQKFMAPK